jgi:hypothetical protein
MTSLLPFKFPWIPSFPLLGYHAPRLKQISQCFHCNINITQETRYFTSGICIASRWTQEFLWKVPFKHKIHHCILIKIQEASFNSKTSVWQDSPFGSYRLRPYWRSRNSKVYQEMFQHRGTPDSYDDHDSNTLDCLIKLNQVEESNSSLQQQIAKAIDEFLDFFDSQLALFKCFISHCTDTVTCTLILLAILRIFCFLSKTCPQNRKLC